MKILKYKFVLLSLLFLTQCQEVFDKTNPAAISENDVWNDEVLAQAYLSSIYGANLPGWPTWESGNSDEANGGGSFMYGQLTASSVDYWPYDKIRAINILLRDVGTGSLSTALQDQLRGQALFFRAWQYFQLVTRYGGVPLVLDVQERSDDLLVSRNTTSETIEQIIQDLDTAIGLLPDKFSSPERVAKGAAYALKGRVLLFYASEQFNPEQESSRWQRAYDANQAAVNFLETNGYGLYPDFAGLWFDENNEEVVFSTGYVDPGKSHNRDACTRPLSEAQNCTGANEPTLALVNAFPMKDGKAITEEGSGYDPVHYWLDRDPRFAATIAWNGALWELSGKTGRRQWNYDGAVSGADGNGPWGGFYSRKALRLEYSDSESERSETDWIEIRFAEVLMNLAEAAGEIGKTDEAYTILKRIRERAGIEAGADNAYGLAADMTKDQMREAILLERQIEFAFENKRPQDLRRRRLLQQLNGSRRQGLQITLIGDRNALEDGVAAGTIDLDESYEDYFVEKLEDGDTESVINIPEHYYFYAIPQRHFEVNPMLEQTKGWENGTFDPLR